MRGPRLRAACLCAAAGLSVALRRSPGCSPEAVCLELHDRLGNNLYQLERGLWLARELRLCFLAVPTPVAKNPLASLLALPEDGVLRFGAANLSAGEARKRCAVTCAACAPPRRAARSGLRACSSWGPCDLGKRSLERPTVPMLRATVQDRIVPTSMFRCAGAGPGPGGLVMHLRSGDTLDARSGFYPQPPCAFYAEVMERGAPGGFGAGLLVTEPDLEHPCLGPLLARFPGLRAQTGSVQGDACTVASAEHLAIGFGTWGPALSRLNARLRSLHVPFGEDNVSADAYGGSLARMSRHWFRQAVHEGPMPYEQLVYSFPGFRAEWSGRAEHAAAMRGYDQRRVVVRRIPARA